jgi:hypothetical protein
MRVPVLFAPVPQAVAQRAAAALAVGVAVAATGDPAPAPAGDDADKDDGDEDDADEDDADEDDGPCCPHPLSATVAVSAAASAPPLTILRGTPMTGSFVRPVLLGRRTRSTG